MEELWEEGFAGEAHVALDEDVKVFEDKAADDFVKELRDAVELCGDGRVWVEVEPLVEKLCVLKDLEEELDIGGVVFDVGLVCQPSGAL